MTRDDAAFAQYRTSFPSDEFLTKHFGETCTIHGNPHRGEVDVDLHTALRKLFNGVLRNRPHHILSAQDDSERVNVFINGVPEPWVDSALERQGLMKELSPEAWSELCREFIYHYNEGSFSGREWWQWTSDGPGSIAITRIPGTARRHLTLAEALAEK
jgi:hypothetical protein